MKDDLDINDELYTDIALQMLTAYLTGDKETTQGLIEGYASSNDDDPVFMPGVIFASILHMSILLSAIAESTNISTEEALMYYAGIYNLQFREQMAKIPALHQDLAKEMYNKIARGE
ncbi:MAG: hypothetical protein RLZZ184_1526 [Cyanobacteriota bacterium]|jgi:hypothetical protein